jgi:hypothetical protein
MKIYVKSRGNLRMQDYLYWLDESSFLSNDQIPNKLGLIDDQNPGLLLFYQDGYYHLLVSSLDSARREPSSPRPIRNSIFFTKIEEKEARFLTIHALQNWDQLAGEVDAAIRADDNPESVYGYKLKYDRLKEIEKKVIDDRNKSLSNNTFPYNRKNNNVYDVYGGVGSPEWSDLAVELQEYALPKINHKNHTIILITKYQPFDLDSDPYILLSDETRRYRPTLHKNSEPLKSSSMNQCPFREWILSSFKKIIDNIPNQDDR